MHPLGLTSAVLLLAFGVAAGLFWLSLVRHEAGVRRDISGLSKSLNQPVSSSAPQGSGRIDLPRFEPNKLVEAINRLALNTKLPLDEISFVLEDNHNQPYASPPGSPAPGDDVFDVQSMSTGVGLNGVALQLVREGHTTLQEVNRVTFVA